jgi:hypothetical protein
MSKFVFTIDGNKLDFDMPIDPQVEAEIAKELNNQFQGGLPFSCVDSYHVILDVAVEVDEFKKEKEK